MSFKMDGKKILDPKLCYDMWVRGVEGRGRVSIYQIPKILAEQGIVNSAKGRNVTPQGVWRAANLYILDHPETAKSDTVSLFSQHGKVFDAEAENEFGKEMIGRARQFLSKTKYKQWLLINSKYKQYEQS